MNGRDFLENSGEGNLEELRQIAYRDFLTGIPNRRFFMDNLSARLRRMSGSGEFLLVGIIDLNGFKAINDLYGHKIGDRILVEVASRLSALMDPGDLMARFGGDEFAFMFSRFDRIREIRERIEEILAELARPIRLEGIEKSLLISGSIGATLFPDDDSDPKTLLHHADLALYEVKKRKQSAWSFYLAEFFPQGDEPDGSRKFLEIIEVDQAAFFFQPHCFLSDGAICGAEIRARKTNNSRTGKSEGSGGRDDPAILRGGDGMLLRQAMEALRRWRYWEKEIFLYVGLGGHDAGLQPKVDELTPLLIEFQDVAHRLVIQVSQSVAHHSFDLIRSFFSKVRRFGALSAIDDFGREGLFFPSLMKLEPDRVVLCSDLVSRMTDDPRFLGLVANILLAGGTAGTEIVASGIEGASHLRILRKLGCSTGRGRFFSPPVTEKEFRSRVYGITETGQFPAPESPVSVEQILLLFVCEEPYAWIEAHQGLFYSEGPSLSEEALLLAGNRAQCGLGRWLSGAGRKSFGQYDEFREIESLHQKFHDIADPLLTTFRSPRKDEWLDDIQREAVRQRLEEVARTLCEVAKKLENRTTNRE
jgi:diguanylate cyclase (GGDEF)-like protein